METTPLTGKVALITGGAQRIGAGIAKQLHQAGMSLALHYRNSRAEAEALKIALESNRPDSVLLIQCDLLNTANLDNLIGQAAEWQGRLDLLVNNASSFYPTPLEQADEAQWDDLMGTNLKAPFFLAKAAAPHLHKTRGSIVNLVDIHGERPMKAYPIYSMAKAGNRMMVKSLARELGPEVRVNGVAPGAILWPDEGLSESDRETILSRTALKHPGESDDIAKTVLFLTRDAPYITGQIISVDGGRTTQQ